MDKKEKGIKWDGKSRISNEVYRKNFDRIFKKKITDENAEEIVHDVRDEEDKDL